MAIFQAVSSSPHNPICHITICVLCLLCSSEKHPTNQVQALLYLQKSFICKTAGKNHKLCLTRRKTWCFCVRLHFHERTQATHQFVNSWKGKLYPLLPFWGVYFLTCPPSPPENQQASTKLCFFKHNHLTKKSDKLQGQYKSEQPTSLKGQGAISLATSWKSTSWNWVAEH